MKYYWYRVTSTRIYSDANAHHHRIDSPEEGVIEAEDHIDLQLAIINKMHAQDKLAHLDSLHYREISYKEYKDSLKK